MAISTSPWRERRRYPCRGGKVRPGPAYQRATPPQVLSGRAFGAPAGAGRCDLAHRPACLASAGAAQILRDRRPTTNRGLRDWQKFGSLTREAAAAAMPQLEGKQSEHRFDNNMRIALYT